MTLDAISNGQSRWFDLRLTLLSLGSTCGFLAILFAQILWRTGGIFEYPLDDPYIHLAMSEQIAAGGYGVNTGEYTSAASSILYPFLLAPFAAFEWHLFVPLIIGVLAMLAAAVIWSRIAASLVSPDMSAFGIGVIAILGPLAINLPGLALLGMEHALHVMAVLMVVLGLIRFAETEEVSPVLVAGIVLNPALRFEGLAVACLACAVLLLRGKVRTSILIGAMALAPVIIYMASMSAIGLDPTPNSVNAKTPYLGTGGATIYSEIGLIARLIVLFILRLQGYFSAQLLLGMLIVWLVLLPFVVRKLPVTGRWLALCIPAILAAHLILGAFTQVLRYEFYALAFVLGVSLFLLLGGSARISSVYRGGVIGFVVVLAGAFSWLSIAIYPPTADAVYAQQRQMGRFVDDVWQGPVAINDLGHVSYRNAHYVLDLWGLASQPALAARLRNEPGWTERLTREHGVKIAMIYDSWLGTRAGRNWIRVARLHTDIPGSELGDDKVDIYATVPEVADDLRSKLRQFAPSLPPKARLEFLTGAETLPLVPER